jgi:hypothetical protein
MRQVIITGYGPLQVFMNLEVSRAEQMALNEVVSVEYDVHILGVRGWENKQLDMMCTYWG